MVSSRTQRTKFQYVRSEADDQSTIDLGKHQRLNETPLRLIRSTSSRASKFHQYPRPKSTLLCFLFTHALQSSKKKASRGPFVLLPMECRKVTARFFCSKPSALTQSQNLDALGRSWPAHGATPGAEGFLWVVRCAVERRQVGALKPYLDRP